MEITGVCDLIAGHRANIIIARGETTPLGVQFMQRWGLPLNLQDCQIQTTIDSEVFGVAPVLLDTSNGGITVNNEVQGQIQINIPVMAAGDYPYRLDVIAPNGVVTPWMCGVITVWQ